jgi:hypothetical protein
MWNENWKKGEDYPAWGNNDIYKKTISGGYSSSISGTVGFVLLVLYYLTPVLTVACLLAVLVSM